MSFSRTKIPFVSLCILLGIFPLAIIVRVYFPSLVSISSDEIASLYFALNPAEIFLTETHPPFFYLLISPFVPIFNPYSLRLLAPCMSLGLLAYAIYLSRDCLSWQGTTILSILILLSPADIFHSRTIRQYSLFFELTLIYVLLIKSMRPRWMGLVVAFFLSGLHPLGWVPHFAVVMKTAYIKRKITKFELLDLMVLLPIFFWYGAKFLFVGIKAFLTHYHPASQRYAPFFVDLMNSFSGEHYPRINHFPIPDVCFYLTILLFVFVIFFGVLSVWRKVHNDFFIILAFMTGITFLFCIMFSVIAIDIWNGRFFIFLLAPIYLSAASSLNWSGWSQVLIASIFITNLVLLEPFKGFKGDREIFEYYEKAKIKNPQLELIFCGNFFQKWFYLHNAKRDCIGDIVSARNSGNEFILVDLNSQGIREVMRYKNSLNLVDYQRFSYKTALRASFIK